MNLHKFTGKTARQAMQAMRDALGADAILLRTQSVPGGVEILAMPDPEQPKPEAREAASPRKAPEMSTLSFQQFVRRRMQQGEATAGAGQGASPLTNAVEPPSSKATAPALSPHPDAEVPTLTQPVQLSERPLRPGLGEDDALQAIGALRDELQQQLSGLLWASDLRQHPARTGLLQHLVAMGWSHGLVRKLLDRIPPGMDEASALNWAQETLTRLLPVDPLGCSLLRDGGVFALTGSTGVGKTTTAAKIAAHFAMRHGAQSVGLITVDSYRVGGHEQLRTLGRMIGVPVHLAHDVAGLAEFLALFMQKRLVLIDTVGLGAQDHRLEELLLCLKAPRLQRLMVLDSSAQLSTTEKVLERFQASQCAGVILSKTDEAQQLAPVLDAVIRHRLPVMGVANGQDIPRDWSDAQAHDLIDQAWAGRGLSANEARLDELLAQMVARPSPRGLHAH
jgi:flagellar biosynthesis protein FlhF